MVCSSLLTLHRANEFFFVCCFLNGIFRFLPSTRLSLSVQTCLGIACRKTVGFMCLFIISLVSESVLYAWQEWQLAMCGTQRLMCNLHCCLATVSQKPGHVTLFLPQFPSVTLGFNSIAWVGFYLLAETPQHCHFSSHSTTKPKKKGIRCVLNVNI